MARILIPEAFTLNSTNVAGSNLPEWASGVAYTMGEQVKVTSGGIPHRAYEARQSHTSVVGDPPVVKGNVFWIDLGAINQHKMFDGQNNTPTVADSATGNIVVEVGLNKRLQSVAFAGMANVREVIVEQIVNGSVVHTQSTNLVNNSIDIGVNVDSVGWWAWLFGERSYSKSAVISLDGVYRIQTLRFTFVGAPIAEVSQCLVCHDLYLGETVEGASPRLKKWSSFSADEIGNYSFTPRKSTRLGSYTIEVDTDRIDQVYSIMEELEERLVFLDANNDSTSFDSIRAYGAIVDFTPGLAYNKTMCDIKIEGIN